MTLEEYFNSLSGKRVGVVGIGVSNLPLIDLLVKYGIDVTACDRRTSRELGEQYDRLRAMGVGLCLGDSYLAHLDFDVIFRTPGLHPRFLDGAKRRGAVITSEMEAFFALCPCRTIAVTGSDGKTTTSTLISELLKAESRRVWLGGNIGNPLLDRIPQMRPDDTAVLELSSFQLHGMRCAPDVAVVTNISPNHLDIHPTYEDYINAKKCVFAGQSSGSLLVLNRDNEITASFAAEARARISWFSMRETPERGCFCRDGKIYRGGRFVVDTKNVLLPGEHNIENLMAAFAAVDGLASDESCRRVAETFSGVRHRLELVRVLRGVRYYNDSIASSPTRTIAGLRSFDEKTILIAGGHDKKVPFDELGREIVSHCRAVFLTGETAQSIKKAVAGAREDFPVFVIDDFREAVLAASAYANDGEAVLLSPACSSFDKFKNFAERGDTFRKIIEEME